ncbi:hypothetical protein [Spirosoma oryzicola]|uniref:hypothetical protein n=1 Tax=Spirosoma oryzicola TaxID=2898794 RepID=UPI001E39C818|nr:hypothetical protein [Spirosoma oryzicola]UHG93409.1 hypothetical protein LQ777_11005 [Spirosoma oryzicola]
MSQTAILQDMRSILDKAIQVPGDGHRQRMALTTIGYRANVAKTSPLEFLRSYFYEQFQAELANQPAVVAATDPAPITPASVETESIQCRSCGRTFKTQTALNGHGEARCQNRQTSPVTS